MSRLEMRLSVNANKLDSMDHKVDSRLLGGNILFDRDRIEGGTYGAALDYLGITSVRYPGGAITEKYFDVANPDASSIVDSDIGETVELLPLSAFLEAAIYQNFEPVIVLPTRNLLVSGASGTRRVDIEAVDETIHFVRCLLRGDFGGTSPAAIEVGNEYWGSGEMTALEYGALLNELVPRIQVEIDAARETQPLKFLDEPKIIVQVGQYGAYSTAPGYKQNQDIINMLNVAASDAIDAVTMHFYHNAALDDVAAYDWLFDRLYSWKSVPTLAHVDLWITEWNSTIGNSDATGLQQAGVIVEMFVEMVKNGVSGAWIWPVQQNTDNDLFGDEGQLSAMFGGEAFRMLSAFDEDTRLVQSGVIGQAHVHMFESEERTVVFASNSAAHETSFALDLGSLGIESDFVWQQTLSSLGPIASPNSVPWIEISTAQLGNSGDWSFNLGEKEVIRLEFVEDGFGANIEGQSHVPSATPSAQFSDTISGSSFSDTIAGHAGDDILSGAEGNDILLGGDGSDTLSGDVGNDILLSGLGFDKLSGNAGNDVLISTSKIDAHDHVPAYLKYQLDDSMLSDLDLDKASKLLEENFCGALAKNSLKSAFAVPTTVLSGTMRDILNGGAGDDFLIVDDKSGDILGGSGSDVMMSGSGDDSVLGGTGDDFVFLSIGEDTISGGAGADVFVIDHKHQVGTSYITDFDEMEDEVWIYDHVESRIDKIAFDAPVSPGSFFDFETQAENLVILAGADFQVVLTDFFDQ